MKKFLINVKIRLFILLNVLLIALNAMLFAQFQQQKMQLKEQKPALEIPKSIFGKIEEGIAVRDLDKFSKFFGAQTYLSIPNRNPGYYSSDQVFYILQDYFRIFKPVSFRFLIISEKSDNPYASGYYKFESKGIRGTAQVYISLKQAGGNWKISQITIN